MKDIEAISPSDAVYLVRRRLVAAAALDAQWRDMEPFGYDAGVLTYRLGRGGGTSPKRAWRRVSSNPRRKTSRECQV